DSPINGTHAVANISDPHSGSKDIGREDNGSIRQPDLSIFKRVGGRLALSVLVAAREVDAHSCGHLLMVLVIAKARPELAGGGLPYQRAGNSIEFVVELAGI